MKSRPNLALVAPMIFSLLVAVGCGDRSRPEGSESATAERGGASEGAANDERPPLTVRTIEAELGDATAWTIGEGTARAAEREYLTFESSGRVTYIKPDLRVGSRVRAGELLARQDQRRVSSDMKSANSAVEEAKTQLLVSEADLQQARTELDVAKTNEERFRVLLEQRSASPQEHDQARAQLAQAEAAVEGARNRIEAARSQIKSAEAGAEQTTVQQEETEIRSPIDGIVAYLNIEEGNYFTPNVVRTDSEQNALSTIPIVVIDTSRYEVTVEVPAFQRGAVKRGQSAILLLSDEFSQAALGRLQQGRAEKALPVEISDELKAFGEVYAVNPTVSPGARSVEVKIRTTGGAERLQDGVFVTAWIATQNKTQTVMVPLNALVYRDNRPYAFIVKDGKATLRELTLGIQDFTAQEVVSGVGAGEQVVTEGRFQLADGAPVRVLEPASDPPPGDQSRPGRVSR